MNELLFHQYKWSLRFMLFTKIFNGGSEENNLKWFLEKSLLNFPSSKKTFLINNSIKSRDSQIHLL